ncbi:MAG: phosphoribosyltransferase family protein [Methanomethylovorans sp.]|uniref:phosphoribosyltransferase family protein n=1 Tax=Methanomethylovorans sp. TaxID=2758717 RepID=UPI003531135D
MNNTKCTIFKDEENNEMWMNNQLEPLYFYEYHPYDEGTNPAWYQPTDGRILDVKDNLDVGVNFFVSKLQQILSSTEYTICVIPSRKIGTQPSGIRSIAKKLCFHSIIDGTEVLHRIKETEKKATGGHRDLNLQIESLEVRNENLIKNQQVLLLDDVTTSGNSLKAGQILLEEAGADLIVKFALGKTVR